MYSIIFSTSERERGEGGEGERERATLLRRTLFRINDGEGPTDRAGAFAAAFTLAYHSADSPRAERH